MRLDTAWEILYKEPYEKTLNPNDPADNASINLRKEQTKKDWQLYMRGPGKILFKTLEKNVKNLNMSLFGLKSDQLCTCPACLIVRDMKNLFELWNYAVEAEK